MLIAVSRLYGRALNLSTTCLAISAALLSWVSIDRVPGRLAAVRVIIVCMVEMDLSTRMVVLWLLVSRAIVAGLRHRSQRLRATSLE